MASPSAPRCEEFIRTLSEEGLHAGLAAVLRQTDYRYIGIFRLDAGKTRCVAACDRRFPQRDAADAVPAARIPLYTRDGRGTLATIEAGAHGLPASGWFSLPIMDADGALLGTLVCCDVAAREPPLADVELLLQVASALAQGPYLPASPQEPSSDVTA
jgi:hypothetical protein